MGNCFSCCEGTKCHSWFFPKKPNLPSKPDHVDRPKPITPLEEDAEIINIKHWDFLPKQNGEAHHTGTYHLMGLETPQLVVRRGQCFSIKVSTSRKYLPETDRLSIVFTVADSKNPKFTNGTQIGMIVTEKSVDSDNGWSCVVTGVQDDSISFEICTAPNAIIGEWNVELDISSNGNNHSHSAPVSLFLLFNPWIPEDTVYVEGDDKRKEYVSDDVGLIWRGTSTRLRPVAWQFGQYKQNILPCILHVLSKVCKLIPANRADPVKVVRAISAGINSPDDAGVLVGNWSDNYDGGTKPTEWSGSIKILQQYFDKKTPVKFGQCWVFSGVVTSACRALGIPCRPITNFSSAHDTHNSLTIDYFFDDDGETIERLNSDSIWNFHVWNECWMRRPDLGDEYNGWQVIDATPQEESDGEYRCGPTSLVAIKRGEINKVYDVPFVFAEVNADKLYWKYRGPNCPMKLLGKKIKGVGLNISTKAVGRWNREDVTHLYKHDEGSDKERTVMKEALRRCENVFARYYLNEDFEDVEFDLNLIDDIVIGKPFSVIVDVSNKGSCERDIKIVLRADATTYTGTVKNNIKKQEFNINLAPQANQEVKLNVPFEEYYPRLVDQCAMNIACLASVKETEYEYFAQDDFRVRKPDIVIEHEGDFVCGKVTKCSAHFINPLPMQLKTPRFYALPSSGETSYIRLKTPVEPKGIVKCEFDVNPTANGEMTINVMFMSKELDDVDGFINVDVKPSAGSPRSNGTNDQPEPPKPNTDTTPVSENPEFKPSINPQSGTMETVQ